MLKKFLFATALLFSVALSAQKIAYVNVESLYMVMPEVSDMENTLASLNESYMAELTKMQEEYQRKGAELIAQQDTLAENIKLRRQQEVQEMQMRLQNFYEISQQDLQKKQEDLLAAINQKIKDTVKVVGEENGYTYVMTNMAFLYAGPDSVDATPQVKQKLGIKE